MFSTNALIRSDIDKISRIEQIDSTKFRIVSDPLSKAEECDRWELTALLLNHPKKYKLLGKNIKQLPEFDFSPIEQHNWTSYSFRIFHPEKHSEQIICPAHQLQWFFQAAGIQSTIYPASEYPEKKEIESYSGTIPINIFLSDISAINPAIDGLNIYWGTTYSSKKALYHLHFQQTQGEQDFLPWGILIAPGLNVLEHHFIHKTLRKKDIFWANFHETQSLILAQLTEHLDDLIIFGKGWENKLSESQLNNWFDSENTWFSCQIASDSHNIHFHQKPGEAGNERDQYADSTIWTILSLWPHISVNQGDYFEKIFSSDFRKHFCYQHISEIQQKKKDIASLTADKIRNGQYYLNTTHLLRIRIQYILARTNRYLQKNKDLAAKYCTNTINIEQIEQKIGKTPLTFREKELLFFYELGKEIQGPSYALPETQGNSSL